MSALLEVSDLTVGYARAPVLRNVSLSVGDGIMAVLGANGAGKTTLLRAIAGTLKAWNGDVRFDGASLRRRSPWSRVATGLAMVPEGRHVFKAMTVTDNLEVAALAGRRRRAAMGMGDVFAMFPRLAERKDQLAGSMSGGEQQMLAVGRALMTGPRLLLIDEMSAGLAPVTAQELVASLGGIRERGVAVLLVEQSPQLVLDVADRVCVLERGTIAASGTVDEIGGLAGLTDLYLGASTPTAV